MFGFVFLWSIIERFQETLVTILMLMLTILQSMIGFKDISHKFQIDLIPNQSRMLYLHKKND
jgi:hypothetical protein